MKKILLFGKDGQVGWEMQRSLAPLGDIFALGRRPANFFCDLTDVDSIKETVLSIKPDVIVNAAAYTAVDKAEEEVELAYAINSTAPSMMAEIANEMDALFVHFSTDYVFNGNGTQLWGESDEPDPLNVYGRSKLGGENAILEVNGKFLIFRTSWVYGTKGNNFIKTILRLAKNRKELSIIDDQIGSPTGAELIADITAHCISNFSKDKSGIYHLSASGFTSWYEYAKAILETAGMINQELLTDEIIMRPIKAENYKVAARRPLNSRLNCNKLKSTFGLHLPDWRVGVDRTLIELLGVE